MKIGCECGATIFDQTNCLPHKAHIVPDQDWNDVLDAIDDAIEKSGPSASDKETACMSVRGLIGRVSRLTWQCKQCGRLYIDDRKYKLRAFTPDGPDVPRELFRSRPSPEQPDR